MGAATYIGRVGALAVALGVGTAVATGYGVASADETSGTPSSSSSSESSSGSASSAGSSDSSGATTASDSDSTSKPTAPTRPNGSATGESDDDAAAGSSTTSKTVNATGGVVVNAQTNTGSSAHSPTKTADRPETGPQPETSASEPEVTEPEVTAAQPAASETKEPEAKAPQVQAALKDSKTSDPNPTPSVSARRPATSLRTVEPNESKNTASSTEPKRQDDAETLDDDGAVAAAATALSAVTLSATSPSTARVATVDVQPTAPVTAATQKPLEVLSAVVSNVVNWVLNPLIGNPAAPAEPPLAWSLLAFARREFDDLVSAVTGRTTETPAATVETTSLSLAAATTALAQAAVNVPAFPLPGAQLSPSTQFVQWVTGNYQTGNPLIADTFNRFGIAGTDVGVIWDNGMVDDPSTPYNEHQVLMAFGDTFSGANMTGNWRFNVLLRSADTVLSDGMTIPDGEWFNGNMFGGTPLGNPTFARQIIHPDGLPAGITLIPTAGISLPTPGTQFGVTQYVNFMSVTSWGAAGTWTTNYSAIAYSTDNGENWTVAPTSVRYNQPYGGNNDFQQGAFVRPGDGYVYNYGTPNGRQGAAYVSRVLEKDILDTTKYEYYSKGTAGGWFGVGATAAGWYKNDPAAATPIFGQDTGACGVANPGNQVSEMSVQYNKQLKKYVVLHGDQFNNIVMRTSDTPQGTWSSAKVLMAQQSGGIYAPMMHPWSPSTMGTGSDLYWNLSLYSQYNVMLMKTDLTKA